MAAAPRYWNDARARNVEACRVCGLGNESGRRIELAHVVGRTHDPEIACPTCSPYAEDDWQDHRARCPTCKGEGRVRYVHPLAVVPLCSIVVGKKSDGCHWRFDQGRLDLLPYLTIGEQAHAVGLIGIVGAFQRTTGHRL